MEKCINIKHPDFLRLLELGETDALQLSARIAIWMQENKTENWPTLGQLRILPKDLNFLNFTENKEIYKKFNLVNKNGTARIFDPTSKTDVEFLKNLNSKSVFYSFYFRKDPKEKYRILIYKNDLKKKIDGEFQRDIKYYNYDYALMEQEENGLKFSKDIQETKSFKSTNPLKSYDSPELIVSMVNLLQEKFNIKINIIHNSELSNFQDVPEINKIRAFVKNGEYFVNVDKADIMEPLHEILHVVLASMKYSDFDNYMKLVESVEKHPLFKEVLSNYQEINSDVLEETFIRLFTDTVRKNILISPIFTEEVFENSIRKAITNMFDLQISLNNKSSYELLGMPIKDILFNFSSKLLESREEIYNTDNAIKMMQLSSLYRTLLKDGTLIQKCDG